MINVDELVESSNGDIAVLYNKLLEYFDGDVDKTSDALVELIAQEEARLEESKHVVDEGKEYLTRAVNIDHTREEKAYWVQREYYKALYQGKPESELPRAKVAREKAIAAQEEAKRTAITEYYAEHPKEASEDGVSLIS